MTLKHAYVSAVADSGDPNLVQPTDWNAEHAWDGLVAGRIIFADSGTSVTGSANFTFGSASGQGVFVGAGTATTDVNGFYLTQTWNNAAVAFTGIRVAITDTASAAGALAMQILGGAAGTTNLVSIGKDGRLQIGELLQFGGTTNSFPALRRSGVGLNVRLADDSGDASLSASGLNLSGSAEVAATGFIQWNARSVFRSPADGQFTISNNAENDFGRLNFGGTTNSFPALKRSTTALQARLADDSDYAPFAAKSYNVNGTAGASFGPGLPTSITVVNGIITAIS